MTPRDKLKYYNDFALLLVTVFSPPNNMAEHWRETFFKTPENILCSLNASLGRKIDIMLSVTNIWLFQAKHRTLSRSYNTIFFYWSMKLFSARHLVCIMTKNKSDHEGTWTLNFPIRSRTPYPLGHAASHMKKKDL